MQTHTLTEHIADWHTRLTVDQDRRLVRGVALAGPMSKNGYRYTEQALKNAARLYEHKPVFLDHAVNRAKPHDRSTRDLVGTIINPRFDAGRIRGDIRVLDTDSGRTFLALAESQAPGVGMSHVVLARRAASDGDVEQIDEVVSVDAVVFPATTTSLRESTDATVIDAAVIDAAGSSAEAMVDAVCETTSPSEDSQQADVAEELSAVIRERDALRDELQAIRERQRSAAEERRLQMLLEAADLPDAVLTDLFREQLLRADDPQRRRLIADRRRLVEALRSPRPHSDERAATPSAPNQTSTFIATIRRHRA